MSEQYNESQDVENILASLAIVIDQDGTVRYNCDWQPGEEGLVAVSALFYKIMIDGLPAEILEEIKQQCVLDNNEGDYATIVGLINSHVDEKETTSKSSDDIVVPPDKVFNI